MLLKEEEEQERANEGGQNEKDALVDLGAELAGRDGDEDDGNDAKTMVVFGTHAGDFNTIEYLQKIRFAIDRLAMRGRIGRILFVVNGSTDQVRLLTSLLDPPPLIEFLSDPTGQAGRSFGCDRGFRHATTMPCRPSRSSSTLASASDRPG